MRKPVFLLSIGKYTYNTTMSSREAVILVHDVKIFRADIAPLAVLDTGGQLHALAGLTPGKNTGTHYVGELIGLYRTFWRVSLFNSNTQKAGEIVLTL